MALVYADRVQETSTTTGTGTYDLAGAVTGFQTFVAGIATGNTCYYTATDGTDWEVGLGTVTDAATDTLARTTILASSNAGAAVSWGAGAKTLFVTIPASIVGGWVPIATLTPSAAATAVKTDLSAYRALRITGINLIPATDGVTFFIRLSSDNGSSYLATNYAGFQYGKDSAGPALTIKATDTTAFELETAGTGGSDQIGNAATDGGLDFEILIFSFNAAQKTKAFGKFVYGSEAGNIQGGELQEWHTGQTAMDAIQFLFSSGNITSGTIVIEGMV